MADDRMSALELRIAELESSIRGITGIGGKAADLMAFSSGSCTNTCTASCTIGCTKGCTGGCAEEVLQQVAQQAQPSTADAATAGVALYRRMVRSG
jgi:hypothetical protein